MFSEQNNRCVNAFLLLLSGSFFALPAYANECTVSGATLSKAAQQYARQCDAPRKDCDRVNGLWYCSSSVIDPLSVTVSDSPQQSIPVATPIPVPVVVSLPEHSEELECVGASGDVWGWNGVASCRLPAIVSQTEAINNTVVTTDSHSVPGVDSVCVDTDNDGWGWNGVASCKMGAVASNPIIPTRDAPVTVATTAVNTLNCIDLDGDGWGWNGIESCRINDAVAVTNVRSYDEYNGVEQQNIVFTSGYTGSSVQENCQKIDSGKYHITELVTDVFLAAGQSNATGDGTVYDPGRYAKDRVNNRVIVWTENNRWEIANPAQQVWHNGLYPGGRGKIGNHPAFQIGRAIADSDDCRVVAFIATAASGMPINYWRNNVNGHYSDIRNTVTNAINALPVKHQLDMIWWMQGEADNDEIVSRYFHKLTDLIAMFRAESWFPYNGYFLANETRKFPFANESIRMLATDDSPFTDYSRGEHTTADPFPAKANEKHGSHFNHVALRKIGDLVAYKYIEKYLSGRQQ